MTFRTTVQPRPARVVRAAVRLLFACFALLAVMSARAQTIIAYPFTQSASAVAGKARGAARERVASGAVAERVVSGTAANLAGSRHSRSEAVQNSEPPLALPMPEQLLLLNSDTDIVGPLRPNLSASVTLSSFSGGPTDGSIRAGTTWVGQVTQNPASISIGGTARNDNGWGATGLSVNATGLNFLNITAQRDPGNASPSLFVQFEDRFLNTHVASVDLSLFAAGSMSFVQISLGPWPTVFDTTQITGWTIGGGGLGTTDFRMTFQNLELTSIVAVPEPSVVSLVAVGTFLLVGLRRYNKRPPASSA